MHTYTRRSLMTVWPTAVMITANHLYSLGPSALALGAVLVVVPSALLWWFRRTQSDLAFIGYMLMNVWIVVGFGLIKGLWGITLPLFLGTLLSTRSTAFPTPALGTFGFEASGLLMFISSAFVLSSAWTLLQAKHDLDKGVQPGRTTARQNVWMAASAFLAVVVVVGTYVFTDQDRWVAPANGVVTIGVIVPTTGPYAVLGNSFVKAVQMAKDDLRDTKYQYQLVIEDSGPDPSTAKGVIRKVVQEEKVDAIVGGVSLIGQVIKPYATKARIPHTCVCTVATIGDGAYNFTNIPSPEAEATRWVHEAQQRGIKTVAVMTQEYPSINNHVKALKAEAARDGVHIVDEQKFDLTAIDFRPAISQAQGVHPDVYYVEAYNPALDRLAQQLSDAGIHNISSVVAPSISEKPALFEGAWYTDSDLVDIEFKARFEDKYPDTQFATHMMPYAYDAFNMIVQAYEHGQNPAVYIRNMTKYNGTAGVLTKEAGSGNFQSNPTVWMIKNGKPTMIVE